MIAPEGKLAILSSIGAVLLLHYWLGYSAFPAWLGVLLLLWLYRDPTRTISSHPLGIVSPVDGTVQAVAQGFDPFLKREALHLRIRMSLTGMYALHSVIEGEIMQEWRGKPGGLTDKGALAVWIQTDEKDDLVVVFHPSPFVRVLRCQIDVGQRIGQGQRCGHILLGSLVELYLSTKARIEVKTGQKVRAGSDVLAELIHD